MDRIRFVAANYGRLQGLRKLPLGLLMLSIVSALVYFLIWPPSGNTIVPAVYVSWFAVLLGTVFMGTVFLYFHIRAYYERRYGSVEPFFHVPTSRKVLYVAIVIAVLNSTSIFILFMGLAMLIAYWRERDFQMHYIVMAVLAIGYGFLHVVGLTLSLTAFPGLMDATLWLYKWGRLFTLTFVGLYLVLGGTLDHFLLVRTMKTLPREGDGRAV